MNLEIEKKYRLNTERRETIVSELKSLGAVFEGTDFEVNTIYGGEILTGGAIVRIRRTQNRSRLTFKRRLDNFSDVKQQTEYETEISDADVTDKILRELSLEPRIVYEKRRDTWRLRNMEILLDDLPFGGFMEIEGSMTEIKEAEMLLGIEDLEAVHETYPSLTATHGNKVGDVIESRFN